MPASQMDSGDNTMERASYSRDGAGHAASSTSSSGDRLSSQTPKPTDGNGMVHFLAFKPSHREDELFPLSHRPVPLDDPKSRSHYINQFMMWGTSATKAKLESFRLRMAMIVFRDIAFTDNPRASEEYVHAAIDARVWVRLFYGTFGQSGIALPEYPGTTPTKLTRLDPNLQQCKAYAAWREYVGLVTNGDESDSPPRLRSNGAELAKDDFSVEISDARNILDPIRCQYLYDVQDLGSIEEAEIPAEAQRVEMEDLPMVRWDEAATQATSFSLGPTTSPARVNTTTKPAKIGSMDANMRTLWTEVMSKWDWVGFVPAEWTVFVPLIWAELDNQIASAGWYDSEHIATTGVIGTRFALAVAKRNASTGELREQSPEVVHVRITIPDGGQPLGEADYPALQELWRALAQWAFAAWRMAPVPIMSWMAVWEEGSWRRIRGHPEMDVLRVNMIEAASNAILPATTNLVTIGKLRAKTGMEWKLQVAKMLTEDCYESTEQLAGGLMGLLVKSCDDFTLAQHGLQTLLAVVTLSTVMAAKNGRWGEEGAKECAQLLGEMFDSHAETL